MKPLRVITIADLKKIASDEQYMRTLSPENLARFREKRADFKPWALANVQAALDDVNGRAIAHTYSASDVQRIICAVERDLDQSGVTVAHRAGTVVTASSGVPVAKAYKYPAVANRITLRRTGSAWMLDAVTKVERYTGPGGSERIDVTISPEARDDVVRNALDGFTVRAPAPVAVTQEAPQ